MLTKTQLKPLFDLIKEANATAIGDGCKAPCVIVDGSLLEQAANLVAKLESEPFVATTVHLAQLKDAGLTFGDCTNVFGQWGNDPYLLCAQERASLSDFVVDTPAVVSASDRGAYVQAWVWVDNDQVVMDHFGAAEQAGYRVHRGEEDAGDLEGRYWWTRTADGQADIESSPDVFDDEDDAKLDAIARHFEAQAQAEEAPQAA